MEHVSATGPLGVFHVLKESDLFHFATDKGRTECVGNFHPWMLCETHLEHEFIGCSKYLVANRADVGIGRELFLSSVGQQIDLGHG